MGDFFLSDDDSVLVESEDDDLPTNTGAVPASKTEDVAMEDKDAVVNTKSAGKAEGDFNMTGNEEEQYDEQYPWEDRSEQDGGMTNDAGGTDAPTDVDAKTGESRGMRRERSPDDPSQYSSWGGISQEFNNSKPETIHFLMSTIESPV